MGNRVRLKGLKIKIIQMILYYYMNKFILKNNKGAQCLPFAHSEKQNWVLLYIRKGKILAV